MLVTLTASFFDRVRTSLFGSHLAQSQVDGLGDISNRWADSGDGDPNKLAYVLATVFHETDRRMQPVEEYGHGRGHPYGLPTGPWHQVYDGRGDVQLTWESNYIKATRLLHAAGLFPDVDLDHHPELALRPDVSAAVVVLGMRDGWFTGKKLADYIHDGSVDYLNARRIVNGTDHAAQIEGYALAFQHALDAQK